MLAKKKNGTNTIDIIPSTAVSAAKLRSAKIRSWSSGSGVWSSQRTKAAIRSAPTMIEPQVAALLQPHTLDCSKPSTSRPIAPLIRTVPR